MARPNTYPEMSDFSGNGGLLGDRSAGVGFMKSATLFQLTAQNALAGNVAPAFDPTRTSENPYKAGESVAYNGKAYTFRVDHYGEWNDNDVTVEPLDKKILKNSKNISNLVELDYGLSISNESTYEDLYPNKYFDNRGREQSSNDYYSVGFEIEENTNLYVTSNSAVYLSICYYGSKADVTGPAGGTRLRKAEGQDTLPYENNPLTLQKGNYVTITTRKSSGGLEVFKMLLTGYPIIKSFSPNIPLAPEHVSNIVDFDTGLTISADTWSLTFYPGKYGNSSGGMSSDPAYKSWVYEVNEDTTLYCDIPSMYYFSVSVTNSTMTSGVRYRKVGSSENTLPSEGNPVNVLAGQKLIISTTSNEAAAWNVVLPSERYAKNFSSSIPLSNKHIEQVTSTLKNELLVQYFATSGENYSTERVYVYVPTKVGYCRYIFFHSVNTDINCDVWRIGRAEAVGDNLAKRYSITVDGEWEMALLLDGRSDFSGGVQHGDEVLVGSPVFMIDGEVVNLSDIVGVVKCKEFRAVTKTDIYDPADNTTVYAEHGCEHVFTTDGVFVNQSVKWLITSSVTRCYLAMNLPRKVVSSKYYTDKEVVATTTPSPLQFRINGVHRLVMFDDTYGVQNEFSLGRNYPSMLSDSDSPQLYLYDHGTDGDNKGYFVVNNHIARTVEAGTVWKASFFVGFKIGK